MRTGYARILEEDHLLPLQCQAPQAADECGQVYYQERARGQTTRRPGRAACLQTLRAGDAVVGCRLDRSLGDPIQLAAEPQARRVHLESLGEGFHTGSLARQRPRQRFGPLADLERRLSRQSAAAGLKTLQACGRPRRRLRKLNPEALRTARAAGQGTVRAIAARLGVAPATVYRNLTEPAAPDGSRQGSTAYA